MWGTGGEVESYPNCEASRQDLKPLVLVDANGIQGILRAESHRPRCLEPGGSESPGEASGTTPPAVLVGSRKTFRRAGWWGGPPGLPTSSKANQL